MKPGIMKTSEARTAAAVLLLIISIIAVCISVYRTGREKRIIYNHRNEYHQIIQDLFDRGIAENLSAREIIRKHPPTKVSTHDNYTTLQYFRNNEIPDDCCLTYTYYVHIIARDNKIVKAFATEGFFSDIEHVFFNTLSETSEDDYWESRMEHAVSMSNL